MKKITFFRVTLSFCSIIWFDVKKIGLTKQNYSSKVVFVNKTKMIGIMFLFFSSGHVEANHSGFCYFLSNQGIKHMS